MKDPYTATMGGFSKVTNFLRDVLMQEDPKSPVEKIKEIINEDIPGMEINTKEEPGYELVTKVSDSFVSMDTYLGQRSLVAVLPWIRACVNSQ